MLESARTAIAWTPSQQSFVLRDRAPVRGGSQYLTIAPGTNLLMFGLVKLPV